METFKKRQKEMLRLEKQREKTARRLAKKRGTLHDPTIPDPEDENNIEGSETGEPGEGAEPGMSAGPGTAPAATPGEAAPAPTASKDGPA